MCQFRCLCQSRPSTSTPRRQLDPQRLVGLTHPSTRQTVGYRSYIVTHICDFPIGHLLVKFAMACISATSCHNPLASSPFSFPFLLIFKVVLKCSRAEKQRRSSLLVRKPFYLLTFPVKMNMPRENACPPFWGTHQSGTSLSTKSTNFCPFQNFL